MSLQDKILKRKLKKKEKQKLKIIEDRKSNTNDDFVEEQIEDDGQDSARLRAAVSPSWSS